jgi:hypothetical protein
MNFERERARINGMIVFAVVIKLAAVAITVYAIVFLVQKPEAVGEWVHRLISAF